MSLTTDFRQDGAQVVFSLEDLPGHEVIWNRDTRTLTHLFPGDHPSWPDYTEHAPCTAFGTAREVARIILEESLKLRRY